MSKNLILTFFVVALFFGSALILWNPGEGQFVDTFNGKNGPSSDIVTLKGAGQNLYDSHLYVEVEKNVPISEASMRISTVNSATGPWIKDPYVDVGLDGNPEWEYSGTGYGDFGRNLFYSDDSTMKTNTYSSNQNKILGNVLIPEGADVHQAGMTVRGRFEATIPSMTTLGSGGAISYTPNYIKFGDVTGDGVNDGIVSTGRPGYLYLYKQVKSREFDSSRISSISSSVYDYVIYDYDNDGDNDIVYGTSGGIYWCENMGMGSFGTNRLISSSVVPYLMGTADIDGDGKDEVVLSNQYFYFATNQTTIFMLKRSSGSNHNLWPIYNTGTSSGSYTIKFLDFGDWNNDNYMDIYVVLTNNRVYTFENPAYSWYYKDTTNISTKTRWDINQVVSESSTIEGFDVGDMDHDGKADVVIAPYSYGTTIRYWKNRGTSSWTVYNIGPSYLYYPRSVSLGDLNGDGYLDVFYSVGTYYYYNKVSWLDSRKNPNSNYWLDHIVLEGQTDSGTNCFAADVDSDGYDDVGLFFTPNRQMIAYYNSYPHDGTNVAAGFIEDGGLVGFSDLEPCDVDKDGDTDMLMTAYNSGTVGWYENDGIPYDGTWVFHRINSVVVGGAREVAWGDIDGDKDIDVAVSGYDAGQIVWFENPGDPKALWKYHYVGRMTYAMGIGVGDFDEDGIMEIVASPGYYYSYSIMVYYTKNPTGSWSSYGISGSVSYCGAINITDMNRDGHLDVIVPVNGYSGSANIYRNPMPQNPLNRQWSVISAISGLQYPYEAVPVEISGDNSLDMVATQNYGPVKWGRAPANPNSTGGWQSYDLSTSISYPFGVDVADIDNDGYTDVFVTSRYWWNYYVNDRGLYWFEEPDDNTRTWQIRTLDSSTRSNYGVAVGDFDENGVTEIFSASFYDNVFKVSRPSLNYPSNLAIDLGNDGISDWTLSGSLRGITNVDFTDELQYVINTRPSGVGLTTDSYGNRILSIPIYLRTQTGGRISGYDVEVRYNISFDIDNNGQLMRAFSRVIPDYDDSNDPTLRIYLLFSGKTPGSAQISDIKVEYNAPPKLRAALPTKFTVNEDSMKRGVVDLSNYFTDDYDAPQLLNYRARMVGANSDKVKAYIENGANLTIDSTITKDFDKEAYVQFVVKDNGGPGGTPPREYVTKEIRIDVLPVDDPPVLGNDTLPAKLFGREGEEVMVADLNGLNLFFDPDDPLGLNIQYFPIIDFEKTYPQDLSQVHVRISDRKLYVRSEGDWYGLNIPLRVYGHDKLLVNLMGDPYHTSTIDIKNVNDPPTFGQIPPVYLKEDEPANNIVDLSPYASDIDTPPLELEFKITSQTNRTFYKVVQDDRYPSKIHASPLVENWYGIVDVEVEVTDGEFVATSGFRIYVEPVNDLPWIVIKDPLENRQVQAGEFSIVGEARDVEGIQRVEVWFQDEWYEALGKNTWGITLIAPDFGVITENVPIQAKVIDTNGRISFAYVNVTVIPAIIPPPEDKDNDGVRNWLDAFPDDPSEWLDSDGDGVGDNSDPFKYNAEWSSDLDGDGIPDQADEYPNDPDNSELPITNGGGNKNKDDRDFTFPIVMFIVSGLLLGLVVISILLFVNKRNASMDPRKMVIYHSKMEKRRDLLRKYTGRDRLEKLLSKMQMKELGGTRPSLPYAPGPAPMPTRGGYALPPPGGVQPMPLRQLPPPGARGRVPPPPPGARPPMRR